MLRPGFTKMFSPCGYNRDRFLAPYAMQFVEELVGHCGRGYPGSEYVRRAPTLPKPNAG
jgi:hypothetical protein